MGAAMLAHGAPGDGSAACKGLSHQKVAKDDVLLQSRVQRQPATAKYLRLPGYCTSNGLLVTADEQMFVSSPDTCMETCNGKQNCTAIEWYDDPEMPNVGLCSLLSGVVDGAGPSRQGEPVWNSSQAVQQCYIKQSNDCHTCLETDACHQDVWWAMMRGLAEVPEWYEGSGVNATSCFEEVQAFLHQLQKGSQEAWQGMVFHPIPRPCPSSGSATIKNQLLYCR